MSPPPELIVLLLSNFLNIMRSTLLSSRWRECTILVGLPTAINTRRRRRRRTSAASSTSEATDPQFSSATLDVTPFKVNERRWCLRPVWMGHNRLQRCGHITSLLRECIISLNNLNGLESQPHIKTLFRYFISRHFICHISVLKT